MPLRVAVVAGEASGDVLGAGLMAAIREREPDAEFFGVAGRRMREAGCEPWHRVEEISVMGFAEVLPHLARLLRLRADLAKRLEDARPDVFVGIDSPEFNLPIAQRLKAAGIPTVQYVSPQVWAWRQSRVKGIRRAVDRILCVLPFETEFYAEHGVEARFVGHPLADEIPLAPDRGAARAALGVDPDATLVALLPGSRRAEVTRLAAPFAETGAWLRAARPGLEVGVALANDEVAEDFARLAGRIAAEGKFRLVRGRARELMTAADAVLTASGTATLEALLLKRPMVVAYRMTRFSYWLVRRLGIDKLPHYSLPNLLAGKGLVEEYVQERVRADVLGPAVIRCLDAASGNEAAPRDAGAQDGTGADSLVAAFGAIHRRLRGGGSGAAADAVLELARERAAAQ